ncbi:MAG: hypothetical protein LBH58_07610 [Tannerellaceae bacterium]|jgi:hypothetical protein|nr:hypothetical protein [Tannerellaceae bacterium]
MEKTIPHNSIRFRRWTRKGYAMFSSLGRCVTIGTLGCKVADASLKKQKTGIPVNSQRADKNVSSDDNPDNDSLPFDILLRLETGQTLLADETGYSEYNPINTKLNNYSRKDIYISPAYFL